MWLRFYFTLHLSPPAVGPSAPLPGPPAPGPPPPPSEWMAPSWDPPFFTGPITLPWQWPPETTEHPQVVVGPKAGAGASVRASVGASAGAPAGAEESALSQWLAEAGLGAMETAIRDTGVKSLQVLRSSVLSK